MKIDAIKIKGGVLDELLGALDAVEAERLKGRSEASKKMRENFPGDSLGDAIGDHTEDMEVPDPEEDRRNKIVK